MSRTENLYNIGCGRSCCLVSVYLMKFSSFFRTLVVGAIATWIAIAFGLGWLATQSSINLLTGGVVRNPQATMFLPKQAPVMFSLQTNPEKLNALRQTVLPLKKRQRDRQEWQQWETDLLSKTGFDYRRDLKPWLGEELTFAIASLDYDRLAGNGLQPGYILAAQTKNANRAKECLDNFYSDRDNITTQQYKGAKIVSLEKSSVWSSVFLGDFVLFANYPQLLKEAILQAQAVDLNLQHSDDYQLALDNIRQPHIGIGYIDTFGLSAWLDEIYQNSNTQVTKANYDKQILSLSLSIDKSDLAAQTILTKPQNSQINKSFLHNPQIQQIFNSLDFDNSNSAYIDLKIGKSLLEDRIPLYKVTKLAIQSLFPHLKAIAIQNLEQEKNFSRADILLKLDR